ncbi:haloacid dehalogenase [Phellopilus nigrolimitatus]|nr:haloacid dehalogenase [Phellopilus nigrolimitatus]
MAQVILAFDIYGTLLDTDSITQSLSERLHLDEGKAAEVSVLWRRYQLEYTWRLNSMKVYEPFDVVTQKALVHALRDSGVSFTGTDTEQLMEAYNTLPCFPDTRIALEKLGALNGVQTIIFSNGTKSMVQTAINAADISALVPNIYVADSAKAYKPAPAIYAGLLKMVGKDTRPSECFLVSGNPFDVTGALAQGMSAIWIDRADKGWTDSLLPLPSQSKAGEVSASGPTKIVHRLEEIVEYMASLN